MIVPRRWLVALGLPILGALTLVMFGLHNGVASAASSWPSNQVTLIIPTSPGGSQDSIDGPFLPEFEKALGTNIKVEYRPGAGFAVGLTLAKQAAPDCNTLVGIVTPQMLFSYLSQKNVSYTYSDFRALGGLAVGPTIFIVQKNAQWKTMKQFIAYAKAHPGQVKISVSQVTSNYYASLVQLEAATGAKFDIVPYNGGGPARQALLDGDVQASENVVFSQASIKSQTRVLAVEWPTNKWPGLIGNVPTFNQALGISLPTDEADTTIGVPAGCATKYPARFKQLEAAFAKARGSAAYRQQLAKTGATGQLQATTGAQFDAAVQKLIPQLKQLVAKYPALQPK